jgi:hypothetical protein
MAETLRFTPGHALADHRGIGGLNRARTRIYRELSRFRNERNGVAR